MGYGKPTDINLQLGMLKSEPFLISHWESVHSSVFQTSVGIFFGISWAGWLGMQLGCSSFSRGLPRVIGRFDVLNHDLRMDWGCDW